MRQTILCPLRKLLYFIAPLVVVLAAGREQFETMTKGIY